MQFGVYRNRNPRTRGAIPLLLDVQSDLLEDLHTRVVVPLAKAPALAKRPLSNLTPVLVFQGHEYLMLTPQLAGISRGELGVEAGTLATDRHRIMGAIDFLLTGF